MWFTRFPDTIIYSNLIFIFTQILDIIPTDGDPVGTQTCCSWFFNVNNIKMYIVHIAGCCKYLLVLSTFTFTSRSLLVLPTFTGLIFLLSARTLHFYWHQCPCQSCILLRRDKRRLADIQFIVPLLCTARCNTVCNILTFSAW